MGFSQGAAMTIHTALRTKYKLGGFISIIGWLPLRKVEPVDNLPTPVNRDTPFLQINGKTDLAVAYYPAATKTAGDLQEVFSNHEFYGRSFGSHVTNILSPLVIREMRDWIKKNTILAK